MLVRTTSGCGLPRPGPGTANKGASQSSSSVSVTDGRPTPRGGQDAGCFPFIGGRLTLPPEHTHDRSSRCSPEDRGVTHTDCWQRAGSPALLLSPSLSPVLRPPRTHLNARLIPHLSQCLRSKFPGPFAFTFPWEERGQSGRLLRGGTQLAGKGSEKPAFEKVPVDAKLLHSVLHSPGRLPHSPASVSLRTICPFWVKVKEKIRGSTC